MSRKKIKKELVRRNISMYDPMGIYGRGLTKNQKEGMTRRMKVEYMSPPPARIDQQLLEDYKKTLIHYGIPTCYHERLVQYTLDCAAGSITGTFDSDYFKTALDSMNIKYMGYSVDTIIIYRGDNSTFPTSLSYTYYLFNEYWTVNFPATTVTALSVNAPAFALESPVKVKDNWGLFMYPRPDANNNDWEPYPEYHEFVNDSSVAKDQVKVGESMPFALYPEKVHNVESEYGRAIVIQYLSDNPFKIIFNFRVIY